MMRSCCSLSCVYTCIHITHMYMFCYGVTHFDHFVWTASYPTCTNARASIQGHYDIYIYSVPAKVIMCMKRRAPQKENDFMYACSQVSVVYCSYSVPCMYACVCVCIYIYIYIYSDMNAHLNYNSHYVCVCVYIYIYVCVYIYIYIYIHTHTYTHTCIKADTSQDGGSISTNTYMTHNSNSVIQITHTRAQHALIDAAEIELQCSRLHKCSMRV
jgi:hypothetical protein